MFQKSLFFLLLCIGLVSKAQNIVSGEYFFDSYKNIGEGTSFSVTPSTMVTQTLSIPTDNMPSGMHTLFIRVKDNNNTWSLVEDKLFYIMPSLSNYGNLTACEWFIDTDPGIGNGIVTNFTTSVASITMPLSINTSSLSSGVHRLYIRVKDDNTIWSLVECKLFYIMSAATTQSNLIAGEWFVDTDPGTGNGTAISFAEGAFIDKTFDINNASFSVGTHKLFVRVKNSAGVWSFYDVKSFEVTPSSPPPPPTANPQTLCKSSTVANLVATGTNLKWYGAATGGIALATTAVLTTKTYYVTQSLGSFESTRTPVPVTIATLPTTPGTISGTTIQSALIGTTATTIYTISAVNGATSYFWTAPSGVNIVSGQGTTTVTVNFAGVSAGVGTLGNLMVQSINATGCKSTAKTLAISKVLPTAPTSLVMTDGISSTAITNISKYMGTNTILKLTAPSVATATSYEWELPTGVIRTDALGTNSTTSSIFVNFSGVTNASMFNYSTSTGISTNVLRIGVKAKNGVGTSITNNTALINPTTASTAKLVTLTATIPTGVTKVTGQITGLCGENTYSYILTPSLLASSYTITAPAGSIVQSASNTTNTTNVLNTSDVSFTVTYPSGFVVTAATPLSAKKISITAVNGVGNSVSDKVITLSTSMPAITAISGAITYSDCDQPFTCSTVIGATSYTWIVPVGATIISGQGTDSVVVNYRGLTNSQTIKVKAVNACGVASAVKSLSLTQGTCSVNAKQSDTSNVSEEIKLYPNPVTSLLYLENSNGTTIDKVIVFDVLGNKVIENNDVNTPIDVQQLAAGTYILQLVSEEQKQYAKFIKK